MTPKQKKFCDEYIKSGNAKQSAIEAGYSPKTAYSIGNENLNKPELKAYIGKRLKQLESEKIAGAREALEYLSSVMRGEQTESVATAKGIYDNVPVSAKDRISAAKELLKRYPTTDPMEKQKLKKLTADARISEARAKAMEENGQDMEQLLDKMLDTLTKEDKKNGNN